MNAGQALIPPKLLRCPATWPQPGKPTAAMCWPLRAGQHRDHVWRGCNCRGEEICHLAAVGLQAAGEGSGISLSARTQVSQDSFHWMPGHSEPASQQVEIGMACRLVRGLQGAIAGSPPILSGAYGSRARPKCSCRSA